MRTYQPDSPQAKARLVALALLADGGLDKSELDYLENRGIVDSLGIASQTFDSVMYELCQDIDQSGIRLPSGQLDLDHPAIEAILGEISHRNVRQTLLSVMFDIVHADNSISQGEAQLTSIAMKRWGIKRQSIAQEKLSLNAGLPPQVRKLVAEACS